MIENQEKSASAEKSDDSVLEEAASRLQKQFEKENGTKLLYGTFRFVFHDGRFQGVEDWPAESLYGTRNKLNLLSERFNFLYSH